MPLKGLVTVTPYIDSPGTRSLVSIVSEIVETVFIMGPLKQVFILMDAKREKTLFSLPLTGRRLPNVLLSHVYTMIYTILLFISNRIDAILFSQIINYPLHVVILARFLRIPILDYIGGPRHHLLSLNIKFAKKFRDKLFYSYGLASLGIAVRLVDRIVLKSRHIAKDRPFTAVYNKISFAWNFPPPDFYTKFKVRRKYDERKPIVGFVGQFTVPKGMLHLINAIPLTINQIPHVKFVLIGGIDDPVVARAMQKLLKSRKIRVKHLRNVPHDNMPYHYNNMMLLVLPSYTEGFPKVILEALACGTPVLVTRVGEFAEIVEKNALGFIVTSRNPQALATQIVSLLSKRDLLSKVSARSATWVRENITYERAVSMWRRIFSKISCQI